MITEQQYAEVKEQYGALLYKIAHQITGDVGVCSIEDNVQDLWMAVFNAIRGYQDQNDGANGTFEEFWGTKGFDKYLKTCLWNAKNSKGQDVTKRLHITRNTADVVEFEEILECGRVGESAQTTLMIEDLKKPYTGAKVDIISALVSNPNLVSEKTGKIDIKALSREVDLTWNQTKKLVMQLSDSMQNKL